MPARPVVGEGARGAAVKYLSICSGIEAASVAWHDLQWQAVGFSEIEPFPCAVLSHRYPATPNFGDMTRHANWHIEPGAVDLVVGGTPCQAFSVAGLRAGLADPRGNLALTFLAIVDRLRPQWVVWENVPGVLSSNGGRDFGAFVGALVELGYGFAYRVLDAQHFGVAQRRRRVYLVANATDWRRSAAVLFEPESLRGNFAETHSEKPNAPAVDNVDTQLPRDGGGLWWNGGHLSQTLDAVLYKRQTLPEKNRFPAVLAPAWIPCSACGDWKCQIHDTHVDACNCPGIDEWAAHSLSPYLDSALRFLTPTECERLQGFPDDWTAVPYRGKPASDGPRYKAIGNSMAVPVMRWIGERIAAVDYATKVQP